MIFFGPLFLGMLFAGILFAVVTVIFLGVAYVVVRKQTLHELSNPTFWGDVTDVLKVLGGTAAIVGVLLLAVYWWPA